MKRKLRTEYTIEEGNSMYLIISKILEKKDPYVSELKVYRKNSGRFFVPRFKDLIFIMR